MNVQRRRVAFGIGAATALVLAVALPAGAVDDGPAGPAFFAGNATARGVQVAVDSTPPLLPISDAFDVSVPFADSTLTSSGNAVATASSVGLGGAEAGLTAICLAGLPCPPGFPPPYPLTAHASYPADQEEHIGAGEPIGESGSPLSVAPGQVIAIAHADEVRADATASGLGALTGTPLPVVDYTGHAVTRQYIDPKTGAFVTRAESVIKDVRIGPLLEIGSVHSIVEVDNTGDKVTIPVAKTEISGVTVLGQPVTIGSDGVHFAGQGSDNALTKTLDDTLAKVLKSTGISIRLFGASTQKLDNGAAVDAEGVVVAFNKKVDGIPKLPDPGLPIGIPDLNATYFGTILIGGAGVLNTAGGPVSLTGGDTGSDGGGTTGSSGRGSGPVAAGGFDAGSAGPDLTGTGSEQPVEAGSQTPPSVAGQAGGGNIQAAGFNPLHDVSDRLELLFPVLFAVGLLTLLGRVPVPAALTRRGR